MARKRATKAAVASPASKVEVIEQNRDFSSVGGRPEFEPSYSQRNGVRLMRADGWTVDRIARRIGVSANTLRKHFEVELSDGADEVRFKTLEDLQRASAKGKVAASNALLKLSGREPPAPAPKLDAPADKPVPEEKLGKKEAAKRAAQTAEEGTSWYELMTDDGPPN